MSLFQRELAAAVAVPVATSALMQIPWVQATLPPGQRVGVITVSAPSLTPRISPPSARLPTRRSPVSRAGASSSACW